MTLLAVVLLLVASLLGASPADGAGNRGTVVIANRVSGDLSLIDVATDEVTTLAMPAADAPSEPMYVVYASDSVFVGDRANDRVVVFDPITWSVVDEVPTGSGVFHMWADPRGRQLWVNNDIDNTITVIDARSFEVLETVPLPADLVAAGGKPHDVILDRSAAYVTLVGLDGTDDALVKYRLSNFTEWDRAVVGKDPHVTLSPNRRNLYVASQDTSEVKVLSKVGLDEVTTVGIPAAHGIDISKTGRYAYVTNIAGGGPDAIHTLDTATNTLIGTPTDAPYPVPHNVVLTRRNDKLYVTHSGATADKVSIYTVTRADPVPVLVGDVTVGLNPFGLEFVPR